MRHRDHHAEAPMDSTAPEHCPQCHHEPHVYHASSDGAMLQRLEHLEQATRAALLPPAPPAWRREEERGIAGPASRATAPEHTLWQGRPAFLASALSVLSAAAWTGLWGVALLQSHTLLAGVELWAPSGLAWLEEHGAGALAWGLYQGAAWITAAGLADMALGGTLLGLTLGAGALCLVRLRRAVRTSYVLTTQRLSIRQGGHWTDVALAELDTVRIRRPFWGRRCGYVHLCFVGQRPVQRRVRCWGVPQRALVQALLQATLHSARNMAPRGAGRAVV